MDEGCLEDPETTIAPTPLRLGWRARFDVWLKILRQSFDHLHVSGCESV
jgi:hypothetical protein